MAHYYVCPVRPIRNRDCSDEDCTQLARAVVFIDAHLQRGHKVVVHCRHGQRRTGVAIYVLLRLIEETQADSLSMMKTMRLKMHEELLRVRLGRHSDLFDRAERNF